MKRCYFILSALFAFSAMQAQYVDFGPELGNWKGEYIAGDIDNDGDLDVIFSGEEDGKEKGAIMINDGAGNFTPQSGDRVLKIGLAGNMQLGDIDGDGDLDIIFTGWGTPDSSRGIALNDGNGIFTLADKAQYPINEVSKVTSCGFADFNLDGRLDYFFFGNFTISEDKTSVSNCNIYFQQPNGSFILSTESFQDLKLNEPKASIVDFDNDGCPDIFIMAGNEGVSENENKRYSVLYKNDGFGMFTKYEGASVLYMKSNGNAAWGDFNGDGYSDLLLNGDGFLNSGENSDIMVRVYKNINGQSIGVGSEVSVARPLSMSDGTAILDWDNDGKLDFFTGGWSPEFNRQVLELYLGDSPQDFSFVKSPLGNSEFPGVSEQAIFPADLNGDNKIDLLVSGYSGGTLNLQRRISGYVKNQSPKASIPPAAPTNLTATVDESDGVMVSFSWEAPASENGKNGTTYNLALKNTTTGKWMYNPMAITSGTKEGWRQTGGCPGNVYHNNEFFLYELPAGTYEWTVQAINGSYFGGKFAEKKTFTVVTTSVDKVNKNNCKVYVADKTLVVNTSATEEQTLNIYNIGGALVRSLSFIGSTSIDMPLSGIYIVEVLENDGAAYRTKAVVK